MVHFKARCLLLRCCFRREEQMDSNQQSLCKKTFKSPEVGALTLLGYTSLIKMYPFGKPLVENGTPSFLMQIMDHFLLKKKKKKTAQRVI